jgi:uncharacterized RDD family membrane protein YckC
MSVIKIPTSFNIDVEFESPEFHRRFFALVIDMVIEILYVIVALKISGAISESMDPFNEDDGHNMWAIQLLLLLPLTLYHLIMEITTNGQSVGKKVLHLKVVDENGGRPGISQFLIRWLLRISDLWIVIILLLIMSNPSFRDAETALIIIFGFGFLMTDAILVAVSKKGQRIGDMLAHTIVIRTSNKSTIEETVFQEVTDDYIPQFPQVMQLTDRDLNVIKTILDTSTRKRDYAMALTAADKIKTHLQVHSSLTAYEFLETLLKDYNYLSTK